MLLEVESTPYESIKNSDLARTQVGPLQRRLQARVVALQSLVHYTLQSPRDLAKDLMV